MTTRCIMAEIDLDTRIFIVSFTEGKGGPRWEIGCVGWEATCEFMSQILAEYNIVVRVRRDT